MPATSARKDSIAYRLTTILRRLNEGEKLDPHTLAEEFGIHPRSIQRDLNERLAFLELEKTHGRYALNPLYMGKLTYGDVERFASLAGVQGLFPVLSNDFLKEILDSRMQTALLVKPPNYEDLGDKVHSFRQLEQAILERRKITYSYLKNEGPKTYTDVEPCKLIHHGGIWYLAGKDHGQLKSFTFAKIERLQVLDTTFPADPAADKTLAEEDDIWLNEKKLEVVLKISKDVAGYFKRRKLISNQVIEKELEDGGLILSGKVAHPNQILPIVRYWIPNVRIISPEGLQVEMESQIRAYLGQP